METEVAWRCRDRRLPVFDRTHVMGILNATPDSFSDGGLYFEREAAIRRAVEMVGEGADIIDIGGESTRPGAEPVTVSDELARVVPIIENVSKEVDVPISVDTAKSEVAEAALDAGAVIVNDVSALRSDPLMEEVVASSDAGVILMHMQGEPRTMQKDPRYDDVVEEVARALLIWAEKARAAGVEPDRIAIDPGIGFGKTKEHNLQLLKNIDALTARESGRDTDAGRPEIPSGAKNPGYPVLVGPSRKSFIGFTLDLPVEERLEGTAAVVAWVVARGAQIVRVHDVKSMVRVVRMVEAIKGA